MAWFNQEEDKWFWVYEVTQETTSFRYAEPLITLHDSYINGGRKMANAIVNKVLKQWGNKELIILQEAREEEELIEPEHRIYGAPLNVTQKFIRFGIMKEDMEKLTTDEPVKIKCFTNCESEEEFLQILNWVKG